MRVIMIGALSIQYIRDNWADPLKKLFDTTFVDVSPLLTVYRNTNYVEKYIYSLLRKSHYDYMFFYSDAINPDFSDTFFEIVRASGTPVVNFLADDEPETWFQQNLPYDHRFDLVATHSKRGYQRRLKMGKADHFIFLPWGFNDQMFDRVDGIEKEYDVVYIGSNLCQEHDPNLYFGDGFLRQKLLVEAYKFCRQHHLTFRVFGPGWHRHPVLKECNGGLLSNPEMIKLYSQARIVLNPGYSADDEELISYQTKLRHFEAAGCGAFQIINQNPELQEIFRPGEDAVYFSDTDNMKEKILYYIRNEEKRQQICNNIYAKRNQHTTESRLKELFNRAVTICPPWKKNGIIPKRTPQVKLMQFNTPNEAKKKLVDLTYNSPELDNYEALHIITGDFNIHNLEYSPWKTDRTTLHLSLTGVRSYLQLTRLYINPIQRKKQNMLGLMLNERIEKNNLDPWLLDYLKEQCLSLEDDKYLYPIMNLLIPVHQAVKVITMFVENDVEGFKKFPKEFSGLLINDLELKPGILPERLTQPPYILELRKLLENIQGNDERLMIYGARGNMTDYVFRLLDQFPAVKVIGFIDRALAGKTIRDIPVYRFESVEELAPTMIIIAAESSGFNIYQDIRQMETRATLIPLHDLTDAVWKVLVP